MTKHTLTAAVLAVSVAFAGLSVPAPALAGDCDGAALVIDARISDLVTKINAIEAAIDGQSGWLANILRAQLLKKKAELSYLESMEDRATRDATNDNSCNRLEEQIIKVTSPA